MTSPVDADEVAARLARIHDRVARAGGHGVQVLAVTKGFGPWAVHTAVRLGLEVGENYAQELVAKAAQVAADRRPASRCAGTTSARCSATRSATWPRWSDAGRASRRVEAETIARHQPGATVLVEVETTGIPGRHGVDPTSAPALVASMADVDVRVAGLMTVAPPDPDGARAAFGAVARLADDLGLAVRSMGMSDDLELAVAAGSTMVRIGRGLFGPRPPRVRAAAP